MLLDLQRAFRKTVTSRADVVAPDVNVNTGAVARRLAVYRNTVQKSLTDVLAAAYPVVERIVGTRFFLTMAADFIAQHPPTVPQLSLYGDAFPAFIAGYAHNVPYLRDVARLEWARGESYFAADAPPLDPQALMSVTPEAVSAIKLRLHPATRLVRSPFPIHRIWSVNQPAISDVPEVDMSVPESVLIVRPGYEVEVKLISEDDAAFIAACRDGATLNDATLAALRVNEGFNLQTVLQAHFNTGTFGSLAAD